MSKPNEQKCGRPADVQFAWGGKIQKMCEEHARQVAMVGQAIGMNVQLERINPVSTCNSLDELPNNNKK